MARIERFGVSMEGDLLKEFDRLTALRRYTSRSEAIRDLIRQELVEEEWSDPDAEVMGAVTLVYDHEITSSLTGAQHEHHHEIVCTTHIHVDHQNCLEVVIIRGRSSVVRHIAHGLISRKGVKHGHLVCTTTGVQLK